MESLSPTQAAEPQIPQAAGASGLRITIYALLAVLLLAGGWVRFNRQIAAVSPMLAAPVADVAAQVADSGRVKGLVELGLVPISATGEAVAAMGLPSGDAAVLAEAVRRERLRLVRLPIFDLSPSLSAEPGGRVVEVSSGGYTRFVRLGRQPLSVTLPMGPVGSVSFRNLSPDAVGIGALTLAGPVRLPDLAAAGTMDVGVIAQ